MHDDGTLVEALDALPRSQVTLSLRWPMVPTARSHLQIPGAEKGSKEGKAGDWGTAGQIEFFLVRIRFSLISPIHSRSLDPLWVGLRLVRHEIEQFDPQRRKDGPL